MITAVLVFFAGMIEYILAVYWTQTVVANDVRQATSVTFVNVMLWGFVVMNLQLGSPLLLIAHAAGCAAGTALTCLYNRERAVATSP